jgi:hypothetical protein
LWLACPRGFGLGLSKSTLYFPRWGFPKTTGISKRKRNAMIRKTRVKYEHKVVLNFAAVNVNLCE